MNTETINHYYVCGIVGVPKKIHPLVAWRLANQERAIINFLDKVVRGEI